MLIACSKNNDKSLDGEDYWISSERNELTLTIKGILISLNWRSRCIYINKHKHTIELTGQNIVSRTKKYSFKDGIFSINISGIKRDYYLKGSEAYNNAL